MKHLLFFSFCLLFFTSCNQELLTEEGEPCPAIACTEEFRSVAIKFTDASGNPISVKDFKSIIRRTGKAPHSGTTDPVNAPGGYLVISDNDTKNLSNNGDTIDVSAVHPQTNQKKTAQFVIKGGKCACHLEKVSGPEEVAFN